MGLLGSASAQETHWSQQRATQGKRTKSPYPEETLAASLALQDKAVALSALLYLTAVLELRIVLPV